jgi:adenosylhomocysteine nucleosidase
MRDQLPRVGLICALEAEAANLRSKLERSGYISDHYRRFDFGLLNGTNVVLVVTGPGKVNAAMTAQRLFDNFHVTECLLSGVAGSISDSKIGDVVIADEVTFHDYGTWDANGISTFPVTVKLPPATQKEQDTVFRSDPVLSSLAEACIANAVLPRLPSAGTSVSCIQGPIASGDQFIQSEDRSQAIRQATSAVAVDMESAAFGQVAYLNDVPFCVIKTISDRANEPIDFDYEHFLEVASERSALIIYMLVSQLRTRARKRCVLFRQGIRVEDRPIVLTITLPEAVRDNTAKIVRKKVATLSFSAADLRRVLTPDTQS